MGVPSAADWSKKMIDRASNAGAEWEKGMLDPNTAIVGPMKKAKARFRAQVQQALTDDSWGKAVDKLTDEEIKAGVRAGGQSAFTTAVTAKRAKIEKAITELQPKVVALQSQLDAMPTDTDAQREAKMIAAKRGMQAIGKT